MANADITAETNESIELPDVPATEETKAEEPINESVVEDIVDIKIENPKKKFRINGDNSKMIELCPTDVNIVVRLKDVYGKLDKLANRAGSLLVDKEEATESEMIESTANALADLDKEMRDLIDFLFDSPISNILADGVSMYTPINGEFWFEHCIDVLSRLYTNNFNREFARMKEKIHKKTSRVTGR